MKKYLRKVLVISFISLIFFGRGFVSQINAYGVWTAQTSAGQNYWSAITSSSDGTKLAAISGFGYIYVSLDGGVTWNQSLNAGYRNWVSVKYSKDGKTLVAGSSGYLYTSIDDGITWTEHIIPGSRFWTSVDSSWNGSKLFAAATNSYLYTSNDGGTNWSPMTSAGSRYWYSISSSSDGSVLVATVENGGYFYVSTDGGNTWIEHSEYSPDYYKTSAVSADGSKIAVGVRGSNGYLYFSNDTGNTWLKTFEFGVNSIAMSGDGTKLIKNGSYISTDDGNSWEYLLNGSYSALSFDGTKIFVAVYNGYIYSYEPQKKPTLSTKDASSITSSSAILNGNILNTGGNDPFTRGFQYGLDTNYGQTITEDGTFNTGEFSSNISNLNCETEYHFRSYAANSIGTSYGNDMTFSTASCPLLPTIITNDASNISITTAKLNGNILDTGGENLSEYGFEYGLTTSYGEVKIEKGSFSTGEFSLTVNKLLCNSTYHYRVFATNQKGTAYGEDNNFTTRSCPSKSIGGSTVSKNINQKNSDNKKTVEKEPLFKLNDIPLEKNTHSNSSTSKTAFIVRTLKYKMIGDDVKAVQEYLNNHGFLVAKTGSGSLGNETKYFGPDTKTAIIEFQKANDLIPDGIIGLKTKEKMK